MADTMKRLIVLLFAFSAGACHAFAYDHISYPLSKAVETPISRKAIANAPKWRDGDDNPPVSARSALVIATRERDRIDRLLDYDRSVYKWKLKGISLKPADGGGWYWLVEFEQRAPSVSILGMVPFLHIPVLMDGTVAVSAVRDLNNSDFLSGP
jgi:hypothetical protein